jgi:hypothetical protein
MLAVNLSQMADLAQLDLMAKGRDARIRALLEDLSIYHMGVYPQNRLAIAVWYGKSPDGPEQHLLELFSGLPKNEIAKSHFSLLWKTGSEGPPFVNLDATSVEYFFKLLSAYPEQVAPYRENYEVLYFDKTLLNQEVLEWFRVITEPTGLMRGWYVDENEYQRTKSTLGLLSIHGHTRPEIGLVKVEESPDFENSRGILHVQVTQRWLPLSADGIRAHNFYTDSQNNRPGYFLFEGGALFQVLRFEVKTAPEYASRLLGKTRDDRYPEVYLRAVHPPAQSAA